MSRQLYAFNPTWLDREYKKAFKALSAEEQKEVEELLSSLLSDLKACRHPTQDPILARWKPTSYAGLGITSLYEYRLGALSRVIARCPDVAPDGDMLLVAATLAHDHPRIKRLIDANKKDIAKVPKPKEQPKHGKR